MRLGKSLYFKEINNMIPCQFCDEPTDYTGTEQCDNCWEVTHRLRTMPLSVIKRILASLESLTFNFDEEKKIQ